MATNEFIAHNRSDPSDTPTHDRPDDLSAVLARAKAMGQRALALRHRGLDTLPEALGGLDELLELDLTGNLLTEIGAPILALTGLEFLTLSRNRLTALPDRLSALTALKALDIGNAVSLGPDRRYGAGRPDAGNAIDTLPAGLGALTRLRRLGAGFVGLRALPTEIGALGELLVLELPGNRIEALPDEIAQLAALETLDLSANPLGGLPDGLAGLPGLRQLNLSDVANLPAVAPLGGLEDLALAGCGLETLPDWVLALPSLKSLYLAGNPMIDLPEGIAGLSALGYLDLSGTGITEPPRHLDLPAGLIVRLGPQRLYQDGRLGHAIGPDGTVITLGPDTEDDDEETETGPIPARPQASGGLGGAGGVVIHRRAGPPPPTETPAPTPGQSDETPTRIVRKADPSTGSPDAAAPASAADGSQTRRGAAPKGGLAARVQAAVAERDANESAIAQARDTANETGASETGSSETGARPPATPASAPVDEAPGQTRRNAPASGLAARVQAAVEGKNSDAADERPAEPPDDADKTQMGRRAAARTGGKKAAKEEHKEEQEETVSQPRDAEGRPIRKTPRT
jgi:hypothetical protein